MTSRRVLVTAADKRRSHHETGAISVDMESAVVALEAQRRGILFVLFFFWLQIIVTDGGAFQPLLDP
jgi:hypothetical protein